MSFRGLINSVLPEFPQVKSDMEIEVLHELPVETLYLALKDSDNEIAQWFFQNALPEQVQGLIDIDCWNGDQFLPDRFEAFFKNLTLVSPPKLAEYMKTLDAEVLVRGLLEYVEVLDFDPQNPPEVPDDQAMLTPDSKFALILKTDRPDVREMLYLWLNKFSAANLDLLRRHLEACKWEQPSDLEEFAYQVKKGRIEEMGFVDRAEAMALYSTGRASTLKEKLLSEPLGDDTKISGVRPATDEDLALREEFLPAPIAGPVFSDGFLYDAYKALGKASDSNTQAGAWREVILMEILRTVNMALSADEVLHLEVEVIQRSAVRARRYLDLGLSFLSEGRLEAGTLALKRQPLDQVYRLGWLIIQDLVHATAELRQGMPKNFFGDTDSAFLESLHGRHPELDPQSLGELGLNGKSLLGPEAALKVGTRLAELSGIARYFIQELGRALELQTRPLGMGETIYSRLMTGLFREAAGSSFDPSPLDEADWIKLAPALDPAKLDKGVALVASRAPESARALFTRRLEDFALGVKEQASKNGSRKPDTRFFKGLNWKVTAKS